MTDFTMNLQIQQWKGRTNIRRAKDLIKRADKDVNEISVIPQLDDLQIPFHITCRIFSNKELQDHAIGLQANPGIWSM